MLIGLLIASNLSGFGTQSGQQPAGKRRKKTYAEAWADHEARRRALALLKPEEEKPLPAPVKALTRKQREALAIVELLPTQAAQDAPMQPRMAGPAPFNDDNEALALLLVLLN